MTGDLRATMLRGPGLLGGCACPHLRGSLALTPSPLCTWDPLSPSPNNLTSPYSQGTCLRQCAPVSPANGAGKCTFISPLSCDRR